MSLRLRPHTLTVHRYVANPGGYGEPEVYEDGVSVKGQITPETAQTTVNRFGVEWARPHLLLVDAGDSSKFTVGNKVLWNDREFRVKTMPQLYTGIGAADHAAIGLEEV